MNKKPKSAKPSAPLKKVSRRESLGDLILNGLQEGIDHARGKTRLRSNTIAVVDVGSVRKHAGMSQAEFARSYFFSLRTLQEWEQGRSYPDSTSRAYLTLIAHDPKGVRKALATATSTSRE